MSSESALPYNGPLSTFREWHAATVGLAAGLLAGWSRTLRRDLRKEPHYAIGAFFVGIALGIVWRRSRP
jgi:hypothetical protein